jgi:glycosyltransferase involved in cell wall biosynthesis
VSAPGVVFVGPYPPPYGGISSHLRDITHRFSDRGIRCYVLSWTTDDNAEHELESRLRVLRTTNSLSASGAGRALLLLITRPSLLRLLLTLGLRRFASAVNRALLITRHARRFGCGVVSIYGTREGDVIPFLRAANPKLRIAFTFFADLIKREEDYIRERRFWIRVFSDADQSASSSRYCGSAASRLFGVPDPQVIYVGVELEKFASTRRQTRTNGDVVSVLFFGRMESDMGVDDALSVADIVTGENSNVEFIIAGATGKMTPLVIEHAARSNGRIKAMVDVASEAVPSMFAAAHILIAPTVGRHACMGVSVKEAMASAMPAVVSDSGGLPEAISDGVEGIVIPLSEGKNDVAQFSNAVLLLSRDHALRQSMGTAGRKKAEALFSNDVTEQRVLELLNLS